VRRVCGVPVLKKLLIFLLLLLACALVAAAGAWWWLSQPLPRAQAAVELSIEPGDTPREVARGWVQAGVQVPDWALFTWFRVSGQAHRIRAGSYALAPGDSARSLLDRLVTGDDTKARVRLIEGWTLRQWRQALAAAPGLQPSTAGLSEAELMARIGRPGVPGEGRFLPDTYLYSPGVSDVAVLRRAADAMDRQLQAIWQQRSPVAAVLASPEQALVLASIVEKETGLASDRGRIAGVFTNRLRIGMPLQTDPTVIYGLGEAFDGNLRRNHLRTDTPFNTYTRRGLPPTPIAMPGLASLRAAVAPEATDALYFVARGDGSSVFSATLDAHNRAVNQYQRGPGPAAKRPPSTP